MVRVRFRRAPYMLLPSQYFGNSCRAHVVSR